MEPYTPGHVTRQYIAIGVHPSGRVHPEQTTIVCEAPGCTNPVRIADSYSVVVTMATTGPAPRPGAYQCGDEQHFACSPACARAAALVCMDHQLTELAARRATIQREAQAQEAQEAQMAVRRGDPQP